MSREDGRTGARGVADAQTRADEPFMDEALRQARRGVGRTSPNPMVGCVIVRRRQIVAVGHHARAGHAHAEVVALRRAGGLARGADVYVTLEPCAHTGRTGPCCRALIAAGVRRVVVGSRDPNPRVNGRGLRALRQAGVDVRLGVLGSRCRALNEAFNLTVVEGRSFIVAKLAQSLDGCVTSASGMSRWVTGEPARRAGHRLRARLDAIVVGAGTVLADDPRLTCRVRGGRDPCRVVLDGRGRTPPTAAVVRAARHSCAPTLVCLGPHVPARRRLALERAGAQTWLVPEHDGHLDLLAVCRHLHGLGHNAALVEGGPTVHGAFFAARLVDRVVAFVAPSLIGGTSSRHAVEGVGVSHLQHAPRLVRPEVARLGEDLMVSGRVAYPASLLDARS